jgi:predicted enzyme related to lactoylglutathione lyase
MAPPTFCRFDLRTTDADAARAFYGKLLGHDPAAAAAIVWPLHEEARARGARPHWLGRIATSDAEQSASAFVTRGAMRYGPTMTMRDGGQAAVLRDAGGAVLAVGTPPADAKPRMEVVWHALNTNDLARAMTDYRELFGWTPTERVDVEGSTYQQFAWSEGGANVGTMTQIAGMAGRHPHWLFFFAVDALDPAVAFTREAGGLVVDPIVLPSGERACVCDDPQGAAFGLIERKR